MIQTILDGVPHPILGHVRGWGLTQAESAKDTSGKLMVMYSFRVHTATTRVPASVKKASKPEPLLVKKLGASKPIMPSSYLPWQRVPPLGSFPPVQLFSLERSAGS